MLRAFELGRRFKFLRGTPLDPFGWTAHRRQERGLIGTYEAILADLVAGLTHDNLDLAIELARLPEQIRGFDLVKDESVLAAAAKQEELMQAFRLRAPRAGS